jgi:hypothetical protein
MTMNRRAKLQREPRRQLQKHQARIWVGTTDCECLVLDVSPGGARLTTDAEIQISDTFSLSLVSTHAKRQPCEVVWRRGNTYGIKFLS